MPPHLTVEMVYASVFWLNSFPLWNGISTKLSPHAIMMGQCLDYSKHCQLESAGTYVQVHEVHDNSMVSYTTGAIALHPTGNVQGGYYFMSLATGHHLNHNHWITIPMPQDVIDHVIHAIAWCQGAIAGLTIADRHGLPMEPGNFDSSDKDDSTYAPDDASDSSDDDNGLSANNADHNPAAMADTITGVDADTDVAENTNDNAENAGVNDNYYPCLGHL